MNTSDLEHTTAAALNFSDVFEDATDTATEELVAVIVPICFGIIAIVGFLGNSLVIFVVLANPQMRSTTNLLIVNLAIADLLFVIFCIPFTATDYITFVWPFGETWCCIVQYLIVVTAFVSIYTLVFMSVDRFLAVVHPICSRSFRTERVTKIAIWLLWYVIILGALPVFFTHGLQEFGVNNKMLLCRFLENDYISWWSYHIVFMGGSYLLPLMIIGGLYIMMIMRLWHQGAGVRMSVESKRGRKRVTRLVVVLVIAFASLWFPIQFIMLLKSLDLYHADSEWSIALQIGSHVLAYTSSCINPVLYAFLSENFRKAFHKVFHCTSRNANSGVDLPESRRLSNGRTSMSNL